MAKRTPPTHPLARKRLKALGDRLRAARLRRKMSQGMLAERVGVTVPTIGKLEDGDPSTSMATMVRVLFALGLGADLDHLAAEDMLGRSLQDNELTRAPPPTRTPDPAQAPPDRPKRARARKPSESTPSGSGS